MRFIIIGGDAAGMSAASRAKRNNPELEVIVLEQGQDVSYSACNIPYNIGDPDREVDDLVVRSAQAFREKQQIDLRTGHKVEHIDRASKFVYGLIKGHTPFALPYDKLLIATGASPIRPHMEGMDLPGVFVVKNLENSRAIKSFLAEQHPQKAIIIGMGYIALEMAEALINRKLQVAMIKPRGGLFPWLHPVLSQQVREHLLAHGVGLYDGHAIECITAAGNALQVISPNLTLNGDMVIVAIGVYPHTELAEKADLALGAGHAIAVDHALRTSDPDIFAAGDCADSYHVVTGKKTWIPLALRANRAGWAVADNVTAEIGTPVSLPGVAGTAVFKVFAMQVARSGLSLKEAETAGFDPVEVQIKSVSRAGIYPGAQSIFVAMVGDRDSGRLLGAQMVGTDQVAHRINAVAVALLAKMTVEQFAQCDLAYAPPFGPTWDPLLVAANQLLKKMSR